MNRVIEYKKKQDKLIEDFVRDNLKDRKNLAKNLKKFFIEVSIYGVATANTEIDALAKKHFSERTINTIRITLSDIHGSQSLIDKASEFWDNYSFKIAGDFEEDRLRESERVFKRLIAEGYTSKELQKELKKILKIRDARRLRNIAVVETTKCFNYARVEIAKENAEAGGIVRGLQFSALLDGNTSDICSMRNGLILAIDDPRIDENTPPLHYGCRSYWRYIDKWKWQDLGGESSQAWEESKVKDTKPDSSWGNAFAYGGNKNK